jgi:hypothetical protein
MRPRFKKRITQIVWEIEFGEIEFEVKKSIRKD